MDDGVSTVPESKYNISSGTIIGSYNACCLVLSSIVFFKELIMTDSGNFVQVFNNNNVLRKVFCLFNIKV